MKNCKAKSSFLRRGPVSRKHEKCFTGHWLCETGPKPAQPATGAVFWAPAPGPTRSAAESGPARHGRRPPDQAPRTRHHGPRRWPPGTDHGPPPARLVTGPRTTDHGHQGAARARDTRRTDQGPSGRARGPGTATRRKRGNGHGRKAGGRPGRPPGRPGKRKPPARARRSRAAWWARPPGKRGAAARHGAGGDTGNEKPGTGPGSERAGKAPGRRPIRARGLGPGGTAWRRRWPPRRPDRR